MKTNAQSAELSATSGATREEIRAWLVSAVADELRLRVEEVHTDVPFDEYGLDSVAAVSISGGLSEWLSRDLPGSLLYEYPTIDELAAHLEASEKR